LERPGGADHGERTATPLARLQAPGQIHHLNIAGGTPYDDAAFIERCVGIENLRGHDA